MVTNNGFLDGVAFDGMRKHLAEDFDAIYILDLSGNVHKNPRLSGTTHNVFGIQVGVSINFFDQEERGEAEAPTPAFSTRVSMSTGAKKRSTATWTKMEQYRKDRMEADNCRTRGIRG